MSPNKIRTFIAIELDDNIRRRLAEIQDNPRNADADAKWVDPKNIHLTLKFIGDVPKDNVEKLCSAIEEGLKSFSKFEFQLGHLGCFPPKGQPRIVWVGVGLGGDLLKQIAVSLSNHVQSFCERQDDKEFSAHITIARIRSNKNIPRLLDLLNENSLKSFEKQTVDHVTLFKSDLTPSGPIHSVIKTFELK